ncbi:fibrinogen-like protein 1 [Pomacea canaliculata]|uniref:fibrinogen-like protein 1 n=1 Tax=Pomacea canaliculata TaxID=400727 RepID=UPI000D729855|nr:fibrinogen-like protein 1 [Pomacea canaliculata]
MFGIAPTSSEEDGSATRNYPTHPYTPPCSLGFSCRRLPLILCQPTGLPHSKASWASNRQRIHRPAPPATKGASGAMLWYVVVLVTVVVGVVAGQESMCETETYRGLPVEVQNEHQCRVLERMQKDALQQRSTVESQYNSMLSRLTKLEQNIMRKLGHGYKRTNVNTGTGFPALKDIPVARDCSDLKMSGVDMSGVYPIKLSTGLVLNVYCDMDTAQGGWTVIQRRQDGAVNFTRRWDDYAFGFGNVNGEFWLGNENIHILTRETNYTLRIDLWDWDNKRVHAIYAYMLVKGEDDDYRLNLGRYSGTAGDSFSHHNGMRFTTPDRDNDLWWANCGLKDQSGWWFNACSHSSLNGIYHHMGNGSALRRSSPDGTNTGIQWYEWKSDPGYSLKRVEMKIKPRPAVAMQKTERLQDAGNGKRPEQPPDKKNG